MITSSGLGSTINGTLYDPGLQDSTDLEAATKSITATSEPGAADYTSALTIAAPSSPKLSVSRICVQLNVTIDSWAGAGTTLNYRIKRGGTSIGTGTLEAAAGTGAKIVAHDVTSGTLTGEATYTVFLWVNADSCVISVCRIYVGVGHTGGGPDSSGKCININHTGTISAVFTNNRQGSGTCSAGISFNSSQTWSNIQAVASNGTRFQLQRCIVDGNAYMWAYGTVTGDLNYITGIAVNFQS